MPADVGNPRALKSAFQKFQNESWPRIHGVIHAAGILEDHTLANLDSSALDRSVRPKLLGTATLQQALEGEDLDFFILFSSAAAVFGSPGQASHGAANASLDAFSHWRQSHGRRALSINWGPWSEIGAAARQSHAAALENRGVEFIRPVEAMEAFAALFQSPAPQSIVFAADFARMKPTLANPRFLDRIATGPVPVAPTSAAAAPEEASAPATASPVNVEQTVRTLAATILMLHPSKLDFGRPLHHLGFDSLMAVQMQNELEAHFGKSVPLAELTQMSLADVTGRIQRESFA
jgi:acyl carrier protein